MNLKSIPFKDYSNIDDKTAQKLVRFDSDYLLYCLFFIPERAKYARVKIKKSKRNYSHPLSLEHSLREWFENPDWKMNKIVWKKIQAVFSQNNGQVQFSKSFSPLTSEDYLRAMSTFVRYQFGLGVSLHHSRENILSLYKAGHYVNILDGNAAENILSLAVFYSHSGRRGIKLLLNAYILFLSSDVHYESLLEKYQKQIQKLILFSGTK